VQVLENASPLCSAETASFEKLPRGDVRYDAGVDLDASSLERLVPDRLAPNDATGAEALRIGTERYAFAASRARPGRLLDCACGVGYGTRLLSERASVVEQALGLDISEAAIAYARDHYENGRTAFRTGDAMCFEDPEGFDTIVSIETIEHLPDPAGFVERMLSLLRPGAVFVASVPTTPSVDANPHHLHDFSERSFRRLFVAHGLVEVDHLTQDQPFSLGAVVTRSEVRLQDLRRNLPLWYLQHPDSLLRRLVSTVRHGFKNRYLTVAWRLPR
jgi:2-polyprenyl-3-methyl-5-hydroxy-6-metoxy-1,4-benzoquinol methylase